MTKKDISAAIDEYAEQVAAKAPRMTPEQIAKVREIIQAGVRVAKAGAK